MKIQNHLLIRETSPPSGRRLFQNKKLNIMKIFIHATLVFLLFANKVNSQINKHNWLVGGNADFSSSKSESSSSTGNTSRIYFRIAPKIGYFIIDKFAAGVSGLINYEKVTFNASGQSKQSYYSIGPFARYYFLSVDKPVNILSEISYYHLISNPGNQGSSNFSFAVGPVFYLNTVVGIEFTAGYSITKNNDANLTYKIFQLGIGLQIHLEKE